jgi:hypothetical protein
MGKKEPQLLKRLRRAFSGLVRCPKLNLRNAYRLVDGSVRVPYEGFPIAMILGLKGEVLHLYPEYPLQAGSKQDGPPSFLIEGPNHASGASISGFVRLEPGKKLTLGSRDPQQQKMFDYPDDVAPAHLQLVHDGDAVIFRDQTDIGTCISPMLNVEKTERIASLQRIRDIYGGPLKPLPKDAAMILIEKVNKVMEKEAMRPRDSRGLPGGLLQLPKKLQPIVVADLHAQVDNLLVILSHNGFLRALEKGEACLVILGDAVHSERADALEDMDDSILMMDLIFSLKLRFPENLFFIRGNHESFSEDIGKAGVPQGMLWKRALKKARGRNYRRAMQRYYDLLPFAVKSPSFCATHAAPPSSKADIDKLIEIHEHPDFRKQLVTDRMRRGSRPGGYTKGDVKRFRRMLGLSADTPFIVGHTPMDPEGTFWSDVGGAKNHHILFSAGEHWVGVVTRIADEMVPFKYPVEPLRDLVNERAGTKDGVRDERVA